MTTEAPRRESYPLVSSNDTLVIVQRDHIVSNARPVLFVRALVDSEIRLDSGYNLDERTGIRVFDFSQGAGDTITFTVNGAATVLTEGVQFTAGVSNALTAQSIAAAIDTANIGLTAAQNGDFVYVTTDFGVVSVDVATGDPTAWDIPGITIFGTPTVLTTGQTVSLVLPTGTFDPLNKVSFFNVLRGRVSADLRSFGEVRTYFRQPGEAYGSATLGGTTGHPGGWPTSTLPPAP